MKILTRLLVCTVAVLVAHGSAGAQQKFPDRPMKIIVPYAPGGGTDPMARLVAKKLSEMWGQPVVVDNKGGAQGNVGLALGASAPADGYTLSLIIHSAMAINPHVFKNMGFDPLKDLVPVARATEAPYVLVANASVPVKTMQDVVALSKSKPKSLNYGTSAVGPQLVGELFKSSTGADLLHVPFNGAGPALNALLAGDIHMLISGPGAIVQHVKSGKLRVIGVFGKDRTEALPEGSTAIEQGFPALGDISEWYGFAVPAKTPQPIIEILNAGIVAAMKDPAVQAGVRLQGLSPSSSTPQELAQRIRSDYDRWAIVIKQSGIKLD